MGSGMCLVYAPGTFEHDDQAIAVVLDPPGDPIDVINSAVEACPMSAIRLERDETADETGT